ncbi:Panacea domain-containing protein [Lysinibacillus sp. NPDC097195]|uniref:Panacea domain-containing protein n=1 Tax=Lysinibacillus sp. NPDC097195 TaxID=3364141 RepID=UPI00382F5C2D
MANVKDVAKYFISLSKESSPYAITPLKLQKLLYYAQGFFLMDNKKPLFEEDLLAWDHGPVNYEIYDMYRKYRYHTIPSEPFDVEGKLNSKEIEAIEDAWHEFGELDGKTLEELTHQEDPWLFTDKDDVISIKLISEYFRDQYEYTEA